MGHWGKRAADAALAVALGAMLVFEAALNLRGEFLRWDGALLLAALVGAVLVGRRFPAAALLVVAAATGVLMLVGVVSTTFVLSSMVMAFLAGRRLPGPRPAVLVFAATVAGGFAFSAAMAVRYDRFDDRLMQWLWMVLAVVFGLVFPWFAGRYLRQRAELLRAGWQRAEQVEREHRLVVERERLRERGRIAQDMHDSLGHELSLIALRAGALELAADLDERHRRAAGELRELAGGATEGLRRIIGLLREDDAAPTRPVDESVADLVERAAASGVAVTLVGGGSAPTAVERAAHRVVQEALTNATKHAPGAAVVVRVSTSGEETVVSVVNAPPPAGPLPAAGGGRGLIGLRERVRLLGGELRAGPSGGGFAVTARLPHAAAPRPDPAGREPLSESAHRYAEARRSTRRGLVAAIVVPTGLAAGLIALMFAFYAYSVANSVLDPATFDRLRVGQDRAEVMPALPALEMMDAPRLPPPPGAGCRYYRGDDRMFDFRTPVLRLCFDEVRLVAKDRLPTGAADEGVTG